MTYNIYIYYILKKSEVNHEPVIVTTLDNVTKIGVVNLDHLVGQFSWNEKTKRWSLDVFFNLVDVAAVAALIMWIIIELL